ncbi:MAG: HD domain-containing protein [Patescibacteria group bacterium]
MTRPSSLYNYDLGCCGEPVSDLSFPPESLPTPNPALLPLDPASSSFEPPDTFHQFRLTSEQAIRHACLLQEVACEAGVQFLMDQLLFVGDINTWNHCYRVGALMIACAIRMDLAEQEIRLAGRVGLTHDVGKSKPSVQQAIYSPQRKRPTPDDPLHAVIRNHPFYGTVMARAAGLSGNVQQCVGNHHSLQTARPAYGVFRPDALVPIAEADGKRPDLARLIGLTACCDVYDGTTAEPAMRTRPYQNDGTEAYTSRRVTEAVASLNTNDTIKSVVLDIAWREATLL